MTKAIALTPIKWLEDMYEGFRLNGERTPEAHFNQASKLIDAFDLNAQKGHLAIFMAGYHLNKAHWQVPNAPRGPQAGSRGEQSGWTAFLKRQAPQRSVRTHERYELLFLNLIDRIKALKPGVLDKNASVTFLKSYDFRSTEFPEYGEPGCKEFVIGLAEILRALLDGKTLRELYSTGGHVDDALLPGEVQPTRGARRTADEIEAAERKAFGLKHAGIVNANAIKLLTPHQDGKSPLLYVAADQLAELHRSTLDLLRAVIAEAKAKKLKLPSQPKVNP